MTEKANDRRLISISRVDELIDRVMSEHPGLGVTAQARYYEDVHQHLVPLARKIEGQNDRMLAALKAILNAKLPRLLREAQAMVDEVEGKYD